jgi:hypothetical protein
MNEPPGAALFMWSNRRGTAGPRRLAEVPSWAGASYPPLPREISKENQDRLRRQRLATIKALSQLDEQIRGSKVVPALAEAARSKNVPLRVLAVRCLAAIDKPGAILEALVDRRDKEVREVAVLELRHWSGLAPKNDLLLHDILVKEKKYSKGQADVIMGLLHSFSDRDLARPETYSRLIDHLHQDQPAIRELAHWHLVRLVPGGDRITYDATADAKSLERAYEAWKKLVPEGSLPRLPKKP